MNRDDLYAVVARIIADLADVPPETITSQARLDDLGVDSITKIELLDHLQKTLDVSISDDATAHLSSVDDIVDHLSRLPIPEDRL